MNSNTFPDRSLLNTYRESIIEQAKLIDVNKSNFTNSDFKARTDIIEKQKIFFWIRVHLNNECGLSPDQDIFIKYLGTDGIEKLETKFICFAKKGLDRDNDEDVVNYNPEDDKKVLCLMVDSERINKDNSDIPFIKTLFKIGNFYKPQILSKRELMVVDSSNNSLEYYDIDF